MSKASEAMNNLIRGVAGRGVSSPQQEQVGPGETQIQDWMSVMGTTRAEAIEALSRGPQQPIRGNAGAGTGSPPRRSLDMNMVIRKLAGRG